MQHLGFLIMVKVMLIMLRNHFNLGQLSCLVWKIIRLLDVAKVLELFMYLLMRHLWNSRMGWLVQIKLLEIIIFMELVFLEL